MYVVIQLNAYSTQKKVYVMKECTKKMFTLLKSIKNMELNNYEVAFSNSVI